MVSLPTKWRGCWPVRAAAVLAISVTASLAMPATQGAETGSDVSSVVDVSGVRGGLVVPIGVEHLDVAIELGRAGRYLVQIFDSDAEDVGRAREQIAAAGLYGRRVAVDRFDGTHVPLIDGVAALMIVRDGASLSPEEVDRVLRPDGVLLWRDRDVWQKRVKPRPSAIDEWTHYLYDPTNNAVSQDDVVGPPRRFQWVGSPRYSRHHDRMSSVSAVVTANNRLFSIHDEALPVSILLPPKWQLVARDASSGVVLWKRAIDKWVNHLWPLKSGPANLPRRLVAVEDRVYVTLSFDGPVSALDAATGETLRTYAETDGTEEILFSDGVLFLVIRRERPELKSLSPADRNRFYWDESPRRILAVDARSGQVLWGHDSPVLPVTLACDDEHVVFHDGRSIVCLARSDGAPLWRSEPVDRAEVMESFFAPTLVLHDGIVLFAGGETAGRQTGSWYMSGKDTMTALSLEDGEVLWNAHHPPSGYRSAEDLLVARNLVWTGETTSGRAEGVFTGRDLYTGEIRVAFPPDVETYWFHHRCYRAKATENFLLTSRTGTEFINLEQRSWDINHWVRGACLYGIMPANGLIYAPQHPCACYSESKLSGFNALAPAGAGSRIPDWATQQPRLEKGPAYDEPISRGEVGSGATWPTYRRDAERSGATNEAIAAELREAWQTKIGGKLTPPVVAKGKVFTAAVEQHTLHAIDAASGEPNWQFTAGARIDSPPTVYRGRVLFGARDGYVYCLRAGDGEMGWRFRAAPMDQRAVAWEQLESVWPVHGSVLVYDGVLYCVAGRSMFLDDGLRLLLLNPLSGELLNEKVLNDVDPATGKRIQDYVSWLNMPPAMPDVLSCDGEKVFMRSQPFALDGERYPLEKMPTGGNADAGAPEPFVRYDREHLFSPTGFLDDTWWHRTYWMYGSDFISGWQGYYRAGMAAPAGRILVFDDQRVYGYGRKPKYYRWTTPIEHQLFAALKPSVAGEVEPAKETRVRVEPSQSLNPANTALTLEAWVKAGEPNGVVFAHGGANLGYVLNLNRGKPAFAVRVQSSLVTITAKETLSSDWTHLAGVITEDLQVRLYVDGELVAEHALPRLIPNPPAEGIQVGADEESTVGEYSAPCAFGGLIDEVRLHHTALSAEEIALCARGGQPPESADTVLAFTFDEGKATDTSGRGNHGEIVAAEAVQGKFGKALRFEGGQPAVPGYRVKHLWVADLPFFARSMLLADGTLFVAGPSDLINEEEIFRNRNDPTSQQSLQEQAAAFAGRKPSWLAAVDAETGEVLASQEIAATPIFDGLAAAGGRLYLVTQQGTVISYAAYSSQGGR